MYLTNCRLAPLPPAPGHASLPQSIHRAGDHRVEEPHKTYVPAGSLLPELRPLPLLMGVVLGIIFGASSLYLVLKVGMTVSASIPVAVISITLFRWMSRRLRRAPGHHPRKQHRPDRRLGRRVDRLRRRRDHARDDHPGLRPGSAARHARGRARRPARHPHDDPAAPRAHRPAARKLKYPEGTACAEVLNVGEQGGMSARTVFAGFGVGFLYKFFAATAASRSGRTVPEKVLALLQGRLGLRWRWRRSCSAWATSSARASPRSCARAACSPTWCSSRSSSSSARGSTTPLFPATDLIKNMDPGQIRNAYVLYIGAGAVAAGGIISLFKVLPVIAGAFTAGREGPHCADRRARCRQVSARRPGPAHDGGGARLARAGHRHALRSRDAHERSWGRSSSWSSASSSSPSPRG